MPLSGVAVSLAMTVRSRLPWRTSSSTTRSGVPTPIKPPIITLAPSGIIATDCSREIVFMIRAPIRSTPLQRDGDVAGHPVGKVGDLEAGLVTERSQVLIPEPVHLLGHACQRVLPARFQIVVDGAPVIGAQGIGEAEDFDLGQAVLDRALNDSGRPLERLLLGNAGGLGKLLD